MVQVGNPDKCFKCDTAPVGAVTVLSHYPKADISTDYLACEQHQQMIIDFVKESDACSIWGIAALV